MSSFMNDERLCVQVNKQVISKVQKIRDDKKHF